MNPASVHAASGGPAKPANGGVPPSSGLAFRRGWMLAGFLSAAAGDWILAVRAVPTRSQAFLAGVGCFALAHVFWMAGQAREARPDWRVFAAVGFPLGFLVGVRLFPVLPAATAAAVAAYAAVSAAGLAVAVGGRRRFYAAGIALLVFSDAMIAARMLHVPGAGRLVGPVYLAAEFLLAVSFCLRREPRLSFPAEAGGRTVAAGAAALVCFALAAFCFPGGGYNPFMRMLSTLGRTEVRGVEWPWSHFLFTAGMFSGAAGAVWAMLSRRSLVRGARRRVLCWGAAFFVAGMLSIAAVPENVDGLFHNAGCWLAALGGGLALLALDRRAAGRAWTAALLSAITALGAAAVLHAQKQIPFAPATPTLQKVVIAAFAAWAVRIAWSRRAGRALAVAAAVALPSAAVAVAAFRGAPVPAPLPEDAAAPVLPEAAPLTEDERAALRWLDYVTGPLSAGEEKEWWDVGGSQHGLFAKRYHIAFCGYAAAALGRRGGAEERAAAGRILGNCIGRYLRRENWAYAMSRSYWGRKPWAPDPCHRENVMYTGHLLQLLALYETFTGDTRYWTEGWDFVWVDGRRVHYTVGKLVDATVGQMRHGPNGGVACEPGLMFFPCNNHPHVALALFARLGHGNWSEDARRWESWALGHYGRPFFGGGALRLVYHVRSSLMFPRGQNALDGWSLLWFEPWTENRGRAVALWREAAARIDWDALETGADAPRGDPDCVDPAPVPPVAAATFLAAAARACGDPAAAERLDRIADRSLVRRDGMLWLDVGREWRVGSTANRIISLAEANGFRFRALLRD